MEENKSVCPSEQDEHLTAVKSSTYKVCVGCGNLYVTVVKDNGHISRVIAHRKSSFDCDLTFFDALNRQTTFQTSRELEQVIRDLKGNDLPKEGHYCRKYNIKVKGHFKRKELAGYSCADAIARVIEHEISK